MGCINVLDFQVANLIAAGEVVERPASAVKELLENAIDAHAKKITVEIQKGGIAFIRVCDDGCGMSREDLPVCIRRHATSKIHSADDLDGITTLGFRGEALAAISSVARMRIYTRQADAPMGYLMTCYAGEVVSVEETGCAFGTTVVVEDLFANVPARRKFLKRDISEAMAVQAVVEKIALSRPDIAVKYISDNNIKFHTAGDGKLENAIYAVLGKEFAKKLTPVSNLTEGIQVEGFIGRPDNVRANRNYQNFFLNGRYVKSGTASAALEQAFHSFIPAEKFPCCVLGITIHPAFVDVNVHPTKLEVKFSNEKLVFDAVYCAVRNTLMKNIRRPEIRLNSTHLTGDDVKLVNAFLPLEDRSGRNGEDGEPQVTIPDLFSSGREIAAGYTRSDYTAKNDLPRFVSPQDRRTEPADRVLSAACRDAVSDAEMSGTPNISAEAAVPDGASDREILPDASDTMAVPDVSDRTDAENRQAAREYPDIPDGERVFSDEEAPPVFDTASWGSAFPHAVPHEKQIGDTGTSGVPQDAQAGAQTGFPPVTWDETRDRKTDTPDEGLSSSTADGSVSADRPVPYYRIAGIIFQSYILLETADSVLMVDKHAAHERILFEQMKANMKKQSGFSQLLLIPRTLTLTAAEYAALTEYREQIRAVGFEYTETGDGRTVELTLIPSELNAEEASDALAEMAGRLADGSGSVAVSRDILFERALYQASCKAAVKAGRMDNEENIRWICDQLMRLDNIKFCPHGRPVALEMTKHQIESQFKRV